MKKNDNDVLKKELVYFLLHCESNRKAYVKIGKSDSESGVVARLRGCQTGNPIKLTLLGYIEGSEGEWQSFFSEECIRGEWFDYNYAKNFISQLNLRIPTSCLKEFKQEKINEFNKKILKIKDQIQEDRERYHEHLDEEEWQKEMPTHFEEELKQIGSLKDEMALVDSLKDHKLKEAYTSWALKNTEEGWYAYERSEEIHRDHRKEALEHMHKIVKIINFMYRGVDSDTWYGGPEIRIAESKSTFFDFFKKVVNPGEFYIMVGEYKHGYSLESGLCIYKLFLNFMNSRRRKVKSRFLGRTDERQMAKYKENLDSNNVKYKNDCPVDISKKIEKLALKSIIDDIKKTIDEDLGVLYFDNNLATWRNKEHEQGLDSYLKQMKLIDKVNLNGKMKGV
jgi:hypothetical protein|tara:strand:- start:40 stop:1221 length:1182 start_codon:yes stop_codon:yes gene_type:complete